jgi:RNA polymerase sigma factor (sigma-70 family)
MSLHQPIVKLARYDLDITGLGDEQLVVLVQDYGNVPARDELISRCTCLKDRLIQWWAARSGLQEADRMDAHQDAVLWVLEAIREYDTGQQVLPRGCRFRTFLYHVLHSRFIDLLRRQRRLHARLRLSLSTIGSLKSYTTPRHNGTSAGPENSGGELLRGMERDELMACLHQEVDRLGGLARELWNLLVKGTGLREIATALNLSYDAAKRQRRKLIARLRACLYKE